MKSVLKILLGLLATALVGVLSILFDILPGSATTAEMELQQRVDQQLSAGDFSWAEAKIDGQKAILTGNAPSHEEFDNALAAVNTAAWRGGVIVGGVTAVNHTGILTADRLPIADPFLWIVERHDGAIALAGYAPSENARQEVFRLVRETFRGMEITGVLDLASGAPPEEDWLIAAATSLHALARLEDGAIEANGAKFVLTGAANSIERADVLRGLMSALPDGMMGVADIDVRATDGSSDVSVVTPDSAESADGSEIGDIASVKEFSAVAASATDASVAAALSETAADDCRNRVREKIAARLIGFSIDSVSVTNASRTHLSELAEILSECPQFSLEISGHTDTTGRESFNRRLSQRRADVVRAFLIDKGVAADQLSARGVGSAEPEFDNATLQGRRRNRRIELDLIFDPQ